MLSRCDFKPRMYTELCNRSSTSSLGLSPISSPMPPHCDTFEDYWEDASVSFRSCPSPWFGTPALPAHETIDAEDGSKSFSGADCDRIWHRSDANEYVASPKAGRRSFPPPMALCSTLSFKGGGRFVLKETDGDRPLGFFRTQRGNGRLLLELVLPDEVTDEDDNDEESFSPVEDMAVCAEFHHREHGSHVEEATLGILEDCSTADKDGMDVMNAEFVIPAAAQQSGLRNSEVEGETKPSLDAIFSDDPNWDASFAELDSYLADNFLTFGKLELDRFVANSTNGHVEPDALWNVHVDTRKQALASLSPWAANQICVHQSIAHIRPALGLAVS